jgi:DNA-binding beta-propeller fold protein YncE
MKAIVRSALLALVSLASSADEDRAGPTRRISTITLPGKPLASFDISWVDQETETYLFADRSNAGVDIIDARTSTFRTRVTGFAGPSTSNDTAGPNGVLAIHGDDSFEAWAGDGDSTVKVIDLNATPPRIVDTISTGGTARADEMAFDPRDRLLLVANDADSPPFITFISTVSHELVGPPIKFPRATNGLEQSVWDPATRLFYLSVPELDGNPATGEIAVIDPRKHAVVDHFPVSECEPAGLVLGPHQNLLVGCSQDAIAAGFPAKTLVLHAPDGRLVATITETGGSDEVWFNRGDGRYYLAARGLKPPALGVIDARTNRFIENVRPTSSNAHSVAADSENNHIFVPLRANTKTDSSNQVCPSGCIAVFASGREDDDDD